MFKRIFIFCFVALYLGTASGMALNLHYCGERLANIQINAAETKSCCPPKAGVEDKCCKNRSIKIKKSNQHEAISSVKVPAVQSVKLFNISVSLFRRTPTNLNNPTSYPLINPPPQAVPISLKNCVFRI
ncbi:MAG: HYC_CC_PP family protein [Sphingobacteriaceae bacterium]